MCLDVAHAGSQDYSAVVQVHCGGGSNQLWWFVRPPGRAALLDTSLGRVPQVGHGVGIVADRSGVLPTVPFGSREHAAEVGQVSPQGREPRHGQQWQFVRP